MSNALLELAKQCEAATGPDRGLDGRIFIAITPGVAEAGRIDQNDGVVGWWPKDAPYQAAREVPRYTGSLDAALTLVPTEYASWVSMGVGCAGRFSTFLRRYDDIGTRHNEAKASAGSFALSVCAAALRARAAIKEEK